MMPAEKGETDVLTEDAVIGSLCEHLAADGWQIVSKAMPTERGTDVVATRAGILLEVEAKGAGSSKPFTAKHGQPFNRAQVRVHVGEAVLKALAVVSANEARAAVAFPDGPLHRSLVGPVRPALGRLGITVFWVGDDGAVSADEPGQ
jgi:hypothetical protein